MRKALVALAAFAFTAVAVIGGTTVQGSGQTYHDSTPQAIWTWDGERAKR